MWGTPALGGVPTFSEGAARPSHPKNLAVAQTSRTAQELWSSMMGTDGVLWGKEGGDKPPILMDELQPPPLPNFGDPPTKGTSHSPEDAGG